MLKLLLNHWQVHREPAKFILTDDPLYCAHLTTTTSQLPEVYSVNRVNPIFEDDEDGESTYTYKNHTRTISENETRSSDDTGYTSGHRKSITEDEFSDDQPMSSDSDEPPKSVIVSADVHRESYPDDVIILPAGSRCSFCSHSLSSRSTTSHEPYDSLTAPPSSSPTRSENSSIGEPMKIGTAEQTDVKRLPSDSPMNAREKLEKLLQQGNPPNNTEDSNKAQASSNPNKKSEDIEKTKSALMQSLTRVLHQKVPKPESVETNVTSVAAESVTRTDTTAKNFQHQAIETEMKNSTGTLESTTLIREKRREDTADAVTRQDESISSSSNTNSSHSRKRHHGHHQHHHHAKHKDATPKPITLHQLLPGHWSYDNVYLPQMPSVCYYCMHHHHRNNHHHNGMHPLLQVPESDMFYPVFSNQERSRHSWAPRSTPPSQRSSDGTSHSSKKKGSSDHRSSPDGSSHESDSQREHNMLHHSLPERRSLRVPKTCKCEDCLLAAFDNGGNIIPHFPTVPHPCSCCYLPHRRVKFASDTDLSKPNASNEQTVPKKPDILKTTSMDKLTSTFPINLHRLNGHVKSLTNMEDPVKLPQGIPSRGKKEPIKMDELYQAYPLNFHDWEAHYKRKFLQKRRKRALNMVGMAIAIILVVGVAVAMTFIFLRMKRPS